jgi:hypothetical protein
MKLSDLKDITLADVKEAVKRTADEKPATAAKLAWGAGITVFVACEWMAINKLNRVVRMHTEAIAKTADRLLAHNYIDTAEMAATDAMFAKVADKIGLSYGELITAADEAYNKSLAEQLAKGYTYSDMPMMKSIKL